jgi:hypothetical protein
LPKTSFPNSIKCLAEILISESANGLQNALNAFSLYWKQWKLKDNTNKTKIMVFSKRTFEIDIFLAT